MVWNTLHIKVAAAVGDLGMSPHQRYKDMISAKCVMANTSLFVDRHHNKTTPGSEGDCAWERETMRICRREKIKGITSTGDNYMIVCHLLPHSLLHTFLLNSCYNSNCEAQMLQTKHYRNKPIYTQITLDKEVLLSAFYTYVNWEHKDWVSK